MIENLTSEEKKLLEKMNSILHRIGLNIAWLVTVGSTIVQELILKRTLIKLGIEKFDDKFSRLVHQLCDAIKKRRLNPPDILATLIKAYRDVRGKFVHDPNVKPPNIQEVDLAIDDTNKLIDILSSYLDKIKESRQHLISLISKDPEKAYNEIIKLPPKERKLIVSEFFTSLPLNAAGLTFITKLSSSEENQEVLLIIFKNMIKSKIFEKVKSRVTFWEILQPFACKRGNKRLCEKSKRHY